MQTILHPKWYPDTKVTCSCGNTFTVGSTMPEIEVEVCSACHPFYTGQMKYVDTAGRVDAFKERKKKAQNKIVSKKQKRTIKKQKRIQRELEKPETLEELRKSLKKRKTSNKK